MLSFDLQGVTQTLTETNPKKLLRFQAFWKNRFFVDNYRLVNRMGTFFHQTNKCVKAIHMSGRTRL